MAFANEVEEFGHDIKFRIGERVKVIIEDIDPKEVNMNTGIIFKMTAAHMHSPKFRRITCTMRMDGEYFKNPMLGGIGEEFTTDIEDIEKITK